MGIELQPLLDTVLAAHGGWPAWQRVERIDLRLSSGGLAFAMRGQTGRLLERRVSVYPHQMRTVFHDHPGPGQVAEWRGSLVGIGLTGQAPSLQRHDARNHFARWRARWSWDDLDLLYFAGYALWNYLSFPFLLCADGVQLRAFRAARHDWIEARFPPAFPTHSPRQYFQIGPDGRLLRHDYVAEVFGHWAAAANFCLASEVAGGLRLYTRRKVVPSLGRRAALPFPTLVWIELSDLQVHMRPAVP
jgi:hypothetical protein